MKPISNRTLFYPFVPKSTAYLEEGDFWSIPLDNGRFACGRVLQFRIVNGKRDSRNFLAGLLDWVANQPPTFETIAGAPLLEQRNVHIKTILESNGIVLGHRPLAIDQIEPQLTSSHRGGDQFDLYLGYQFVRVITQEEARHYPGLLTGGYGVLKSLAEKYFGKTIG